MSICLEQTGFCFVEQTSMQHSGQHDEQPVLLPLSVCGRFDLKLFTFDVPFALAKGRK